MYILILAVLVTILYHESGAQNFWQPLNGPNKGQIRCLAINPSNQIFCKADSLWRSNDNGATWIKASPLSFEVYAVSFSSSGNIYLSTPYEIYKSTNDGATWVRMGTGLIGYPYTKILFNSAGHLFIGGSTTGMFKSTNDGATFQAINTGLTNLKVKDLAIKNDTLFVGTDGAGVFRSTDGGANWSAANTGYTTVTKAIYYLQVNAAGRIVLANVNGRIFTSVDNASNWTETPTMQYAATPKVFQMNSLGHMYVFMNSIMYRTTNYGVKWDTVNTGLTGGRFESSIINSNGYIFLGDNSSAGNIHRSVNPTTGINDDDLNPPSTFSLSQNYPNPFNPSTSIDYFIKDRGWVSLKVFDVLGNEVQTLVNEEKPIGRFQVIFDGRNLQSGIYFYILSAGSFSEMKKIVLLK